MNLLRLLILSAMVLSSLKALAITYESDPVIKSEKIETGLVLEYLRYEEYVYSKSKKTELGDSVQLDTAIRYQHDPHTFGRLRFKTDPIENRIDNKTSEFEFLAGHRLRNLYVQVDTELETNESDKGGSTVGFDLDSELTRISYNLGQFVFTFYPFNFDGEVGYEFNTWDVTRIHFIDGAPSSVDKNQINNEQIATKTIPGIELKWLGGSKTFYIGFGSASYLYPKEPDFDLVNQPAATTGWERKEDLGYKFGGRMKMENLRLEFQYVGHSQSEETGSLLESAGSVYTIARLDQVLLEIEGTYSQAGKKPYRLDRSGEWFEDINPFQPVYSDVTGLNQQHDWLGESDFAASIRIGWELENSVPYLTYKYQGEHFIFRDRESAHRLRNFDESLSHGGLQRLGFGTYWYQGNFVINPEFEYMQAENPVFANSSDVRDDRLNASFRKEDYSLFLKVSYFYDGSDRFEP